MDFIKAHSRIDYDCEDDLLELYANSAEETVLKLLGRSYENLIEECGEVPAPVKQAALMLVDLSYKERSPISPQQLYAVPYTVDVLIKPYMVL